MGENKHYRRKYMLNDPAGLGCSGHQVLLLLSFWNSRLLP